MRINRRRSIPEVSTHGIDLAPMLDFCINLLIFFIITAVFVKQYGMVVNRPVAAQLEQQQEPETIVVRISNDGKISIDNRVIDIRALRANVEREIAGNPESSVLVAAHESAPTGLLVKVVDQAHLAGVYNVTFATQK